MIAALTPEMFLKLLREHPVVNECMLNRLVKCVRELADRVYDLTTHSGGTTRLTECLSGDL